MVEEAVPVIVETNRKERGTTANMADWWGGILETVKQKSEVIINMYKEDLQEFTSTITEDTKKVIETNVTKANAIGGIEKIISHISGGATDERDKILSPPIDASLYTSEPEDQEDYNAWLATFDIKTRTEDISDILAGNEALRNLHRELVPASVTYGEFWQRYYYHYGKLKEKEDRRAALLQRANAAIASDTTEDLGWDLDDFENDGSTVVESSEKTTSVVQSDSPSSSTTSSPAPIRDAPAENISTADTTKPEQPQQEQSASPPVSMSASPSPSSPSPSPAKRDASPSPPPSATSAPATSETSAAEENKKQGGEEDWADWE